MNEAMQDLEPETLDASLASLAATSTSTSTSTSSEQGSAHGVSAGDGGGEADPRKGPLSFLSGSVTSLALAWLFLQLSQRVVAYYLGHPPHYNSRVAQSIAVAVKTLVVGMGFLATFTCGFVGLGLALVFLRSLRPASPSERA